MTKLFILILSLTFIITVFSQNQIPDLITDRPDKTESASVVPSGSFQIETGLEYMKEFTTPGIESNSFSFASTLIRYGLLEKLELRLGGNFLSQNYKSSVTEENISGLSVFMLGAKYEFLNNHSAIPDIALLIHFFFPAGAEEFKPDKTEPQLILSVSKNIIENLDIGVNLGSQNISAADDWFYFYTVAAGIGLTEKLGTFAEIYSELIAGSEPFMLAGTGLTYLLLPNLQLDITGGNGLFNNSKVWYFGAGISIRIPR